MVPLSNLLFSKQNKVFNGRLISVRIKVDFLWSLDNCVPVRVPMHKFKEAYTTLCYSFLCGVFVDVVV